MKASFFRILILLMFVIGCQLAVFSQSGELTLSDGVNPHKGIDGIYKTFSEGYRTLKPELVADLYTETAAYISQTLYTHAHAHN